MQKTIIGSTALKHWFGDSFKREPKDLDYFVDESLMEDDPEKTNGKIQEYIPAPSWWKHTFYATPEEIITLKASHIFWTPLQRDKHIADIEFLLYQGFQINDKLFYRLYDHWHELKGKRSQSNQNLDMESFFDDLLTRQIHHDQVHLFLNPQPVYKKILVGDGTVNISEDKFNDLSFEEKLNVVREEVYVLSFERWDSRATNSPVLTYRKNLRYFIGHLAPTWLSLFAMKNLITLSKPHIEYKKIIEEGLENLKKEKQTT